MAKLRVRLHLADSAPEDAGSPVRVAVLDTSRADELHPTVAEAQGTVPEGGGHVDVVIDVPDEALKERGRYSLWGHVYHKGSGELRPGDLIITQNVPVTPKDLRRKTKVEAKLTRI